MGTTYPPKFKHCWHHAHADLADRIASLLSEPEAIRIIFGDLYLGSFVHVWGGDKRDWNRKYATPFETAVEIISERIVLIGKAKLIRARWIEAQEAWRKAYELIETLKLNQHSSAARLWIKDAKQNLKEKGKEADSILREFTANARTIFSYNVMISKIESEAWTFAKRAEAGRRNGAKKKGAHSHTSALDDQLFGYYEAIVKNNPLMHEKDVWDLVQDRARSANINYQADTIRKKIKAKLRAAQKSAKTPIKPTGKKAK